MSQLNVNDKLYLLLAGVLMLDVTAERQRQVILVTGWRANAVLMLDVTAERQRQVILVTGWCANAVCHS